MNETKTDSMDQSADGASKMRMVQSEDTFQSAFNKSPYAVLFFWADWHDPCKQIAEVISELANDHHQLQFFSIDAEEHQSISTSFNVEAVPTIILAKNQKESRRLEAENVPNTVSAIEQFANHSKTAISLKPNVNAKDTKDDGKESIDALNARITKIIAAAPIMLFMKGTPEDPKCKFSRATIDILKKQNVTKFGYFNILNDPAVRAQIKVYSNWKTFPQLYVHSKLIGGLDVIKELIEDDEFDDILPKETKQAKETLHDRLTRLVNKEKVMLFMKGTPEAPQCGFSNQIVQILRQQDVVGYGHFNILDDQEVRQGLKTFSNWPTFPQLYVKGQLVGGLDVVKELIEDDEFADAINV